MWFRFAFATCMLAIIGIAGVVPAQELPPPEPKPKPRPERPAEPKPTPRPGQPGEPTETPAPPDTQIPPPAPPGSLLIKVDAPCKIVVDGEDVATLAAGRVIKVPLDLGEHLVEANSTEQEGVLWEKLINIEDNAQKFVRVGLAQPVEEARLRRPFTHEATGLMWTPTDSGDDKWNDSAGEYCSDLVFGGFTDWRLPTIEELKSIYFPDTEKPFKTVNDVDVCGTIQTGFEAPQKDAAYVWSSERSCIVFEFGAGAEVRPSCFSGHRVLCVRGLSNPDG
ncbi:MAG: DUF1566 domain-containing protein [bacterium]|nr:DUF1566 domain-containing protein [bacterium]